MKKSLLFALCLVALLPAGSRAVTLTSIPGPDDQGGMIMPMVGISGNSLTLMFMPPMNKPDLLSLNEWSFGDDFSPTAAWYSKLNPAPGGAAALFNNQYGFMWSGTVPVGKALGIRLLSRSSSDMESWNYVNSQNLFDEVFANVGDQVLWNGNMWHNYFTLPNNAPAGSYTASLEVFIADATFTAGTGWADYTPGAMSAAQDMSYSTVTVNYAWDVVPEPSTYALILMAFTGLVVWKLRKHPRAAE
ncbi:MAG: PEP-CTERM sorting domain-containing protein [Terrimicrobiaceae bacterium]